jgi:hypothetical protein
MPMSAMTISDDGSLVRKRMFSGLSRRHTLHPRLAGTRQRRVLETAVGEVMAMQVLHTGQESQDRTGQKHIQFLFFFFFFWF